MKFTGERMIPEYNENSEIYLEHLNRYIFVSQFIQNKRVLDIACGSGYGVDILAKNNARSVIGVDISKESIEYCKERYKGINIKFLFGNATKIPLDDDSVDVVVSLETVEHLNVNDQKLFLKEIKRVLTPSGILIMSTPNKKKSSGGNEFHLSELSIDEYKNLLSNNFKFTEIYYQDNLEGNYIFNEQAMEQIKLYDNKNINLSKICKLSRDTNAFFISISCNRSNFVPSYIMGNVSVSNNSDIERLKMDVDILHKAECNYLERIKNTDEIVISHAQWVKNLQKENATLKARMSNIQKKVNIFERLLSKSTIIAGKMKRMLIKNK